MPAHALTSAGLDLDAIRVLHVERCEAALDRALQRGDPHPSGLPYKLISAGCWLVANGWWGEPCEAERLTNWGPERYRLYLSALDPAAHAAEMADGYRALFGRWKPIVPDVDSVTLRRAA